MPPSPIFRSILYRPSCHGTRPSQRPVGAYAGRPRSEGGNVESSVGEGIVFRCRGNHRDWYSAQPPPCQRVRCQDGNPRHTSPSPSGVFAMTRSFFAVLAVVAFTGSVWAQTNSGQRPNVVFILADDLGRRTRLLRPEEHPHAERRPDGRRAARGSPSSTPGTPSVPRRAAA